MKILELVFVFYVLLCVPAIAAEHPPPADSPVLSAATWEDLKISLVDPHCRGCIDGVLPLEEVVPVDNKSLALTVRLQNTSATRKVDLNAQLNLMLVDEYGNEYRWEAQKASSLFLGRDASPEGKKWSLYPGEIYEETFTFEPPVPTSHDLKLRLDLTALGATESLTLDLAVTDIAGWPQPVVIHQPSDDDLLIELPQNGTQIRAGQSVIVQLRLTDGIKRPDRIMIFSPEDEIEDSRAKGRYILTVPEGYQPGPFTIVIIARWEDEDEVSVSKGLTLEVIAPDPCWDKCDKLPQQAKF